MSENVYEGMFILDTNRYGRDNAGVSGQISEMIEKAGGKVLVSRFWEERRLAYPIKGYRKGSYWLTYFQLEGPQLAGVEHQCKLNDNILRVLFLKIDPRLVDALVLHAQATGTTEKKADTVKADTVKADTVKADTVKEDTVKEETAEDKKAEDKKTEDKKTEEAVAVSEGAETKTAEVATEATKGDVG